MDGICYIDSLCVADKTLYTIKAVSVSNIRSIRRHIPAIGWPHLIVVLSSGT